MATHPVGSIVEWRVGLRVVIVDSPEELPESYTGWFRDKGSFKITPYQGESLIGFGKVVGWDVDVLEEMPRTRLETVSDYMKELGV